MIVMQNPLTDNCAMPHSAYALDVGGSRLHTFNVAELLEREVVSLHSLASHAFLKNRIILVTGAAGSIGSELCRQLLDYEPALVIGLDSNETGIFDLAESLHAHPYRQSFQPTLGDISNGVSMERLFDKQLPHIIFHVAAYKHVPLLEQYPEQAVHTNVLGTYQLCLLAKKYRINHFIFVSTDKAVDPISIMGASKRFGEMMIQALARSAQGETCFCAVRFGNVIGSRGSVVPTFARQIEEGGPITITHPEVTRYFMTISEACGLVIHAAVLAETGNIYLLDMGQPIRILDLARKMIYAQGNEKDIAIVYTGLRPGERLHEALVAANEEICPTSHGKIFCVLCKEQAPALTTMTQWAQLLEHSLLDESEDLLRQHLFTLVSQQSPVLVHG